MKVRLAKLKNFIADNVYILAAMLAVDFIMAFVFYFKGLWPFGDTVILQVDLHQQYWPLFTELYDRLTEHKSLIYSWNTGLGGPFLGNFYNYLSSPFLIYILLAGRNNLTEAISMMIVSKASLAAGTFTYYLKKSQGSHSFLSAAFGVLYAQCGWFLAFYWNVMWLDALYLLPLVALGIERLIKDKKPLLYIISLAFTLLTSYYMGYMVCIFSVIWFLVYYFSNYRLVSDTGEHIGTLGEKRTLFEKLRGSLFINRGFTFAFSSIIAAGLVTFALIPTFFILRECSATSEGLPNGFTSYFNLIDFIYAHLSAIPSSVGFVAKGELPNVRCGIIVLALFPIYYFSNKIKLKEKIIYTLVIAFLYISLKTSYLNYVWHAFHLPNGLPYRYSYLYSFVILVLCFKALSNIREIKIQYVIVSEVIVVAVLGLIALYKSIGFSNGTLLSAIVFTVGYFLVILAIRSKSIERSTSLLVLFCLVIVEMTFCNTGYYYNICNDKSAVYYGMNDSRVLIERLNANENDLYRVDFDNNTSLQMRPAAYEYNGITSFSSMNSESLTYAQRSLGMESNGLNSFLYNPQTPVYNMMHSVKYILGNYSNADENYYVKADRENDIYAIKNKYCLPISFVVNSRIKNWKCDVNNPCKVQSDWFELASDTKGVFTEYKPTISGDYENTNGIICFSADYSEQNDINIQFDLESGRHTYLYVANNRNYRFCEINKNNTNIMEPKIIDLGVIENDKKINICFSKDYYESKSDTTEIYAYCFYVNDNVLNKGYEKLKQSPLEITSFNETNIKGTVNAKEDGVMWTSIPYDKGWSVTVDGKAVKTIAVQDAYLCFNMPAGNHTIELNYTQPGLKEGICISIASLLLCAAYIVVLRKKKQK